jgi:hypothetical protein
MCVHIQKPIEPGHAHFITSVRCDIVGQGLSSNESYAVSANTPAAA